MHWQKEMLPVAGSKTDVFIPGKIGFGAGEERRVGATASRVNREREKGEKKNWVRIVIPKSAGVFTFTCSGSLLNAGHLIT